jgi:hypothetical protein
MWTAANKKELTPMQLDKSVVEWGCCRRKRLLESRLLMPLPPDGGSYRGQQ